MVISARLGQKSYGDFGQYSLTTTAFFAHIFCGAHNYGLELSQTYGKPNFPKPFLFSPSPPPTPPERKKEIKETVWH